MGFSLCGIPVGRGYVKTLRISGVEDSTWQGRVVDRKPTALPCGDGRNRRTCCPDCCRGACQAGASVEFTGIRNTDKGERRTKYSEAEPNNWSSRFVSRSRGLAEDVRVLVDCSDSRCSAL